MHIVHGTWIPSATDAFVQNGTFYLWVESDTRVRGKSRRGDGRAHPRHLAGKDLEAFLDDKLGIHPPYHGRLAYRFDYKTFLLPTAGDRPLPSHELAPYVEMDIPDAWELAPWQMCCFRLRDVIPELNDIHFTALHAAEDFQLGADFLFWHQLAQVLKGIMAGDHYIPALSYRALEPAEPATVEAWPAAEASGSSPRAGRRSRAAPAKKAPDPVAFELYPGWELRSDAYEQAIRRYAACMPPICAAGFDTWPVDSRAELHTPATLLRHFAEHLLDHTVSRTPISMKLETQMAGSLLHHCRAPGKVIPGSEEAFALYKEWAEWRAKLRATQDEAAFKLAFRLTEAPANDVDAWRIDFLVASRRDPSLQVSLDGYWSLDTRDRKSLASRLGPDFEKHLLLALGYAARIYDKTWEGLETDRPVGFQLSLDEAFAFLKEHAWVLEDSGYGVIVPAWCMPEGRRRAKVRLRTSTRTSSGSVAARSYFSLESVIDYQYELSIGGEPVSQAEWQRLVSAKTPLVHFRGQWMEVDRERMQQMLAYWQERQIEQPQMTLLDLIKGGADGHEELEWDYDPVLRDVLAALEDKSPPEPAGDPEGFQGTLREYQRTGTAWLRYLERLGLNPLLADDMGLGKTVQVIAQLVAERNDNPQCAHPPTLLVAPTSVLGNWRKEIERFAPHLRALVHQGAARVKDEEAFVTACRECDVVITSFALARMDEKLLRSVDWGRVVVDEAQNIKNPKSAQARAIARLPAESRVALTGTPVENRLRDLWSIFNFLNPGYLGKEAQFRKAFEVPIEKHNDAGRSAELKRLVEPFILRRLKTDPRIIRDLPEKSEQKVYCSLTPEQASLYEALVKDVETQIEEAEGIQRRGLILATLTKLKQICNHPAQFLQDGSAFTGERSHKLQRLAEMMEEVIDNGESLLIFTQFTEIGGALERYIARTLHYNTYYLHGGTSAAKRERMVTEFQDPETEPAAFILSVRAGGTGLTLTKANHVFHFDRWWNPAVEDQATDRAFRIGQRKNVFAHKFVSLGTVEERIDAMIEDKKRLAQSIVGSDESWLTELDNDAFKDLIALRRTALVG